jgi:aminoglycoside phosphotransferase (APT) family kinase protein
MIETTYTERPEEIINRVRPNHKSIEWFNGGDNRYVVVVDHKEAFRFPKDDSGVEVGRFEFKALQLVQGKLTVAVPRPIELAPDGSYNVLSFLKGKVLSKQAVTELPAEKRRDLGIAIGVVINELNANLTRDELSSISTKRSLVRNRDDYYAQIFETAVHQDGSYAAAYRDNYERLQKVRPGGSARNVIVFGDFSSPNLVLSEDDHLTGLIDWTELGFGDIHNELRPVFSVIGQQAFEEMVAAIDPKLGSINQDLVRMLAVIHELSVLVNGKQKGVLTPERIDLAKHSLNQWLDSGWVT